MNCSVVAGLLFLAACTRVERNVLPPTPPTFEELQGNYEASFGGDPAAAQITAEAISFAPYPCATTESIGGSYEYEDFDGSFSSEVKSLDGAVKILVAGTFLGTGFEGTFEVRVLGLFCTSGVLEMTRTH